MRFLTIVLAVMVVGSAPNPVCAQFIKFEEEDPFYGGGTEPGPEGVWAPGLSGSDDAALVQTGSTDGLGDAAVAPLGNAERSIPEPNTLALLIAAAAPVAYQLLRRNR